MLCNTISHYPDGIDDMIFFQDNDLEKAKVMNHYNHLIAQVDYNEANEYISRQSNIYGYFADFFNAIENRIYSLQESLLKKSPKKKFFIYTDNETAPDPSSLEADIIWIQECSAHHI